MSDPFLMFVLIVVVAAIIIIKAMVKIVPQGEEFTVERFGRYTHTLKPGLGFITPFIDKVGSRINMKETVLDIPSQEVITRDNAMVVSDGVVFYQIVDAAAAAYEVRNLEYAISNLALTNMRTVIGAMDLDDVLSNRDVINEKLMRVVDAATNPWGIKVTRIEIKDLSPPRDITEAMTRQMKAEREKRAEIISAEGQKQAAILVADGQKKKAILESEGRKEAAFRDAEARERQAEAEAKATRDVSKAIAEGDIHAINYFVACKYVQAIENLASADNQKTLILPIEATGVLGSLAGVTEIAKTAFHKE
ncbi:MAG: SPFH domain-containing protein [Pseudomonadota bacterium]|nr:SPFH domain-containing protein [Pseudomonadota bacterium]